MKYRKKLILLIMLIAIFLGSGCGEGTYRAEKMFWQANYRLKNLIAQKDEKSLTPDQIDSLIFSFKEITIRYPRWENTSKAHFILASLYLMKSKPETARQEYELVYKDFPSQIELCAMALKNIAVLYELEDKWEQAEQIYRRIIEEYHYTNVGLMVSLNLAQQYKKKGHLEKAKVAFQDALKCYKEVIRQQQNLLTVINAVDFAVACVLNLEGPEPAIEFLQSLKVRYAGSEIELRAIFNIAKVYQYNVNNKEEAIKYYQQILEKDPNRSLGQKAREEIEKLSE